MTSACNLRSFVTKFYMKTTCKSRVDVRLGKLPMVRRTLFCRRRNFKRQLSAANSHATHA